MAIRPNIVGGAANPRKLKFFGLLHYGKCARYVGAASAYLPAPID